MRAARYHEYGPADVIVIDDVPEPHAGPGEIRIRVAAAGVNPIDWKLRSGEVRAYFPVEFPAIPGRDAAGVVDEVGDGVSDVTVGDKVFGLGGIFGA
ncbi:alcohol dehydrogenase catalytic domain-containing protein, partial [Streptomyces sp. SID7982]|nr:alcohol dehydrogenase catalytic domain-containing protein [Streptomyces sp. SID7982]